MKIRLIFLPLILLTTLCATIQAKEKPTLVVMDLKTIKADDDLAKILSERLRTALSKIGKYQLVSREEMENIVKEMKFQRTEMCDDAECYAEIGMNLGAKKMVAGSIARMGRMYTLNLKLIDIGKAVDEGMATKDCECTQQMLLRVVDEAASNLMGVPYTGPPVMEGDEEEIEKPYIAVLEFETEGGAPATLKSVLTDKLIGRLIDSKAFNVIDRASMDKVLKEQEFEISGCTASECAVEAGQLLGVDKVVIGRLSKISEKYFISTQLIDVGSSKIEQTADDTCTVELDTLLSKLNGLAVKLAGGESALRGGGFMGTYTNKEKTNQQGIGSLYIKSEPEGAKIIIDGIKIKNTSPATVEDIPAGSHNVELIKGFLVASKDIELTKDQFLTIDLKLKPIKGKIKFLSKPLNAEILLDGRRIGKTPHIETDIEGGEHEIELKRKGYASMKFTVTIKNTKMLKIKKQLKQAGALRILCDVEADLFLNGKNIGISPLRMDSLPVGPHKISVEKEGFEKYNDIVHVRKNDTTTVKVDLKPLYGYLTVLSTPDGASVSVNGRLLGKTPIKKYMLKVGKKTISIALSQYQEKLYNQEIFKNRDHRINAALDPLPASIMITSEPYGADIFIDGKHSGKTKDSFKRKSKAIKIKPGKRKIRLELANYKKNKWNITVKPGEKLQKKIIMEMTDDYMSYQSSKTWRDLSYIVAGLSFLGAGVMGTMWFNQRNAYDESKKLYEKAATADDVKKHFSDMKNASDKANLFLMTSAGLSGISLSGLVLGVYKSSCMSDYKVSHTGIERQLTFTVMLDIKHVIEKGGK